MLEIITTGSSPKQNPTLFENLRKVDFLGHIFSDKGYQPVAEKVPRPQKVENSLEQKRCNPRLRKFGFLQSMDKNFACGFKTFL